MASISSDKQGVLNITLNQGDNRAVSLIFRNRDPLGVLTPIDLMQYSEIKMDVKETIDINAIAFISWAVGSGLTISGDNNEILSFEFEQEFYESQNTQWFYDMKFIKASKVMHLIKGVVNVNKVTTK